MPMTRDQLRELIMNRGAGKKREEFAANESKMLEEQQRNDIKAMLFKRAQEEQDFGDTTFRDKMDASLENAQKTQEIGDVYNKMSPIFDNAFKQPTTFYENRFEDLGAPQKVMDDGNVANFGKVNADAGVNRVNENKKRILERLSKTNTLADKLYQEKIKNEMETTKLENQRVKDEIETLRKINADEDTKKYRDKSLDIEERKLGLQAKKIQIEREKEKNKSNNPKTVNLEYGLVDKLNKYEDVLSGLDKLESVTNSPEFKPGFFSTMGNTVAQKFNFDDPKYSGARADFGRQLSRVINTLSGTAANEAEVERIKKFEATENDSKETIMEKIKGARRFAQEQYNNVLKNAEMGNRDVSKFKQKEVLMEDSYNTNSQKQKTEIIPLNGKNYEVDHITKKVIREVK